MIQTAPLYYFFMSAVSQIVALGVTIGLARLGYLPPGVFVTIAVQALVAFLCARALKLSKPWQAFNLLLVPALFLLLHFGLPAWVAILGLTLSLIIYIPTFWTRVPFYPTSTPMYEAILRKLPSDREFSFIDLGCGYGTLLRYLAQQRPLGKFYGSEIAPLPYVVARVRALLFGNRMRISFKSFWNINLEAFDFVYAFLAPDPMPRLWDKAQKEMRSGSLFLVNTFKIEARAQEEIVVHDKHRCTLYVYRR